MTNVIPIEKEVIPTLSFSPDEVLTNKEAIAKRRKKLDRATLLGNNFKRKVKIVFKTKAGKTKQVETTSWAVGSDFIVLKAGMTIPIHSILDIKF